MWRFSREGRSPGLAEPSAESGAGVADTGARLPARPLSGANTGERGESVVSQAVSLLPPGSPASDRLYQRVAAKRGVAVRQLCFAAVTRRHELVLAVQQQ